MKLVSIMFLAGLVLVGCAYRPELHIIEPNKEEKKSVKKEEIRLVKEVPLTKGALYDG